jgi:hypothetical protein
MAINLTEWDCLLLVLIMDWLWLYKTKVCFMDWIGFVDYNPSLMRDVLRTLSSSSRSAFCTWLVAWMLATLVDSLVTWMLGGLVAWMHGCLLASLVDSLVAWMLGGLVAWMHGYLVASLVDGYLGCWLAWWIACLDAGYLSG